MASKQRYACRIISGTQKWGLLTGWQLGLPCKPTWQIARTPWERKQAGVGPVPGASNDYLSEMINTVASGHRKSAHTVSLRHGEHWWLRRDWERERELLPLEVMLLPWLSSNCHNCGEAQAVRTSHWCPINSISSHDSDCLTHWVQ